MVGMQSHFGTAWTFSTLDSKFEWLITTNAEFMFTLAAGEVHATTFSQSIFEFASWTFNSIFL